MFNFDLFKGEKPKKMSNEELTIKQQEGYIIALEDIVKELKTKLDDYKDALKWRKEFKD